MLDLLRRDQSAAPDMLYEVAQAVLPKASWQFVAGASEEMIARFALLGNCRLPAHYTAFLRVFGIRPGLLWLAFDGSTSLPEVIGFYEEWLVHQDSPPSNIVPISTPGLAGPVTLHYGNDRSGGGQPNVALCLWSGGDILASTFCNWLYDKLFDAVSFEKEHGLLLAAPADEAPSVSQITRAVAGLASVDALWFSDCFQSRLSDYRDLDVSITLRDGLVMVGLRGVNEAVLRSTANRIVHAIPSFQ